jgi:hypothetical protein
MLLHIVRGDLADRDISEMFQPQLEVHLVAGECGGAEAFGGLGWRKPLMALDNNKPEELRCHPVAGGGFEPPASGL